MNDIYDALKRIAADGGRGVLAEVAGEADAVEFGGGWYAGVVG